MDARALLFIASIAALPASALADEANEANQTAAARESFLRGAQLVRDAQWAEALVAFEQSTRIRKHATTTFNLGACQRAMGHYLLARKAFLRALAENEASGGKELTPALAEETKQAIAELTKLEARFDVDVTPADVRVAVDGRPLEAFRDDPARPTLLGGTLPAGAGAAAPGPRMRILLDPGAHVLTVSRAGFADAVRNETFAPGATKEVRLELDRLPAQLRIASQPAGGQVLIDDADVGLSPLTVSRPAGRYRVTLKKKGYVAFETVAAVDPGQSVDVTTKLVEDKPALTQRWWFWAGAGVLLAGAAATTYLLTRPEPERPAVDGGGLGWAVKAP